MTKQEDILIEEKIRCSDFKESNCNLLFAWNNLTHGKQMHLLMKYDLFILLTEKKKKNIEIYEEIAEKYSRSTRRVRDVANSLVIFINS